MQSKYRTQLPQLLPRSKPFLAEGGLETDLIFRKGFDLPHFAAFTLIDTPEGKQALRDFYISYVQIARQYKTGIVLQVPTWRLSEPWIELLGYTDPARKVMQTSLDLMELLSCIRTEFEDETTPIVISGSLGSMQDAYKITEDINFVKGRAACKAQVAALAAAGVDMLSFMTTSSATEAIAIVELARDACLPIMVSFSVETDGLLLGGSSLATTIRQVDEATNGYAVYFGINCAHPQHFLPVLRTMDSKVLARLRLIRANASVKSHEELDNSEVLDRGDLTVLAECYRELCELLPGLVVIGGCCGTDEEHVGAIAARVLTR